VAANSTNGTRAAERGDGDLADLAAVVRAELARWGVPGIAVGTLNGGDVRLQAFGTASVETGQPVAPGTLFQIGSITKVFLATLAMRLVEAGKLDLDAPVATYLPDVRLKDRDAQQAVTFRHLLSHTSGILGDYFPDHGWGDDALAKAIAGMAELDQITPLGGSWSYCNSGFYLAGQAIERITGKPFEAVMAEQIFAPLGLERSTFWAHEAITHSAAVGHLHEDGPPTVARPYPLARVSNPAGGIISCTRDLLRFAAFHLDGRTAGRPDGGNESGRADGERVLSAESLAAMREVQATINDVTEWGLGWSLGRVAGVRTLAHGGGTNGFITNLTVVPEMGYAIAVLTNSSRGGAAIRGIVRWALANECGLPHQEPARVTLPAEQLSRLEGVYRAALARATVTADPEAGTLKVETVGINPFTKEERTLPASVLAPLGEWSFVSTEGETADARVEFLPGPDGRPAFARIGGRLAARDGS
jgi:CubicO group peptidase (beta-lactamase class C family)